MSELKAKAPQMRKHIGFSNSWWQLFDCDVTSLSSALGSLDSTDFSLWFVVVNPILLFDATFKTSNLTVFPLDCLILFKPIITLHCCCTSYASSYYSKYVFLRTITGWDPKNITKHCAKWISDPSWVQVTIAHSII